MKNYTINFGTPKKMILDLSEDGTYYNAKFYVGFVDPDEKIYEGWVELKVDVPAVNNIFKVRDYPEDDGQIFSIIVADEEQ